MGTYFLEDLKDSCSSKPPNSLKAQNQCHRSSLCKQGQVGITVFIIVNTKD